MPVTAEQEALRRLTAGRKRTHETYITGVRQFLRWLETQPPPACHDDSAHNYDGYVEGFNGHVLAEDTGEALLVTATTVRLSLGLTWALALAVARTELAHDAARRQHLAVWGDREGPLRIISATSVATVLGVSTQVMQLKRSRGELPAAAVTLDRKGAKAAWLRDDIEALAAGVPVPDRVTGWMQNDIVLLPELAARLGYREDSARTALHQRRATVPQSDGRVGGVHYWTRDHFESWWAARTQGLG